MGKKRPPPFNNPFADHASSLRKSIDAVPAESARVAPPPPPPPPPTAPVTDEGLFFDAIGNVRRMHDDRGHAPAAEPSSADAARVWDEDAEAFAELASLVAGDGTFDIADTDEFIEGATLGLDRRVLQRLRRGDFSVKAHLDLHGLTREPARLAVERFIEDQYKRGHRCVLIVHGRGHNSKDQIPVLKSLLRGWLERGRIARAVLAFATARPNDGGAGAVYVLLRRTRT